MNGLSEKALGIVLIVIIIAIGAIVLDEFRLQTVDIEGGDCVAGSCNTSTAYNVTVEGLGGMDTFGDWIDIIVIMIVIGVIIGLIYGVFRYVGGSAGY